VRPDFCFGLSGVATAQDCITPFFDEATVYGPGCVKTLRGITAPGILSYTVMRIAKKCKPFSAVLRAREADLKQTLTGVIFEQFGLRTYPRKTSIDLCRD
jgi:hypothetical protein